jgi:transcription antitermination factor NusG
MPWYAIYTRARNEKKVEAQLRDKRYEVFLPLITQVRQWKDRKKKVDMPLFSSYLFVNFEYKQRFEMLQTDGIVKIINFNGQPAVVPDWQIESLRTMLEHPETLQLESYIKLGDLVEVINGPMRGLRGMVIRRKSGHRLVLTIDGIMQSVSVEVAEYNLKKIKD